MNGTSEDGVDSSADFGIGGHNETLRILLDCPYYNNMSYYYIDTVCGPLFGNWEEEEEEEDVIGKPLPLLLDQLLGRGSNTDDSSYPWTAG